MCVCVCVCVCVVNNVSEVIAALVFGRLSDKLGMRCILSLSLSLSLCVCVCVCVCVFSVSLLCVGLSVPAALSTARALLQHKVLRSAAGTGRFPCYLGALLIELVNPLFFCLFSVCKRNRPCAFFCLPACLSLLPLDT